jgi:hypothetical protein
MSEEGRKAKVRKRKAASPAAGADEKVHGPAPGDRSAEEAEVRPEKDAAVAQEDNPGEIDSDHLEQPPAVGEVGAGRKEEARQTTLNGDNGTPHEVPADEKADMSMPIGEGSSTDAGPATDEPGDVGNGEDDVPVMEEVEPGSEDDAAASQAPLQAAGTIAEGGAGEGADAVPREKPEEELPRLKREFSERLFELELEKNRMEELGTELAARSEELERSETQIDERMKSLEERDTTLSEKHKHIERREAELTGKASQMKGREADLSLQASALKKMEAELSRRHEMISASTEAMNALDEELRQKDIKVRQSEEEVARSRREFEALRSELAAREEKVRKEMAESEEQKKSVELLVGDIHKREEMLKLSEAGHGKKMDDLARARKDIEELEGRLKDRSEGLRRREDEVGFLEQHLFTIEEELHLCPHCSAIDEFSHLSRRSDELRERGEDTQELNVEISEARKAVRAGDYEKAASRARRAAEILKHSEQERARREVIARIVEAESLARMLSEVRADVSGMKAMLSEAWAHFKGDRMDKALEAAEKARLQGLAVEKERFEALDELAASNSVILALRKSGVNMHDAEQKRAEAENAMGAGDFKKAKALASETVAMVSEAAQSQDVASVMSQIKLAEETLEELRSLGLDVTEWDRMVNRSRDFLKKLDFKSAEETGRWARQKARDAGRQYRHSLMAIDHSGSVISTYKDMGLIVRKAEDLQDEAKVKLKEGDSDLALNLARKAEKMVREIAERHKGAQAALKKATTTMRVERKSGRDITKGEKLYDLAQHQLELGEYANAMKLATKAAEAVTSASVALLELCPTCGEAIPENIPECPSCAEKKKVKKDAAEKGSALAQRSKLGSKGGRKYACPYCSELFEITVPNRPLTIGCPWCGYDVSVVD